MRMFILLSDNDTWDSVEGCTVVLAKEESELSDEELKDCIEYNPRDFAVKTVKLSKLLENVED